MCTYAHTTIVAPKPMKSSLIFFLSNMAFKKMNFAFFPFSPSAGLICGLSSQSLE